MIEEEERVPPSTGERLEAVAGQAVRHANDDTIELPLTEKDMLALSRAAGEEDAETSLHKLVLIATGPFLRDQSGQSRTRRLTPVFASSVLGVVIGGALGIFADRLSKVTMTVPPGATRSTESLESPVRFSNPFDVSEVFEFPTGTSYNQARESVAAVLLQRARDRQAAGIVRSNRPMPVAAADHARIARNSEPPAASSSR
jgi:hypothetical protein